MTTEQGNTPKGPATDEGYDVFASTFDTLTLPAPAAPAEGEQSPAGVDAAPAAKSSDAASSGTSGEPAKPASADATSASAGTDSTTEGNTEGGSTDGAAATAPSTQGDGKAPAPTPPPEKDWQAEAARLQAELEAANARAKEPASSDKSEASAGDAKPDAAPARPVYTDDEKAVLDAYKKEWPDVMRGESLMRRAEYKELVGYIFDQIQTAYGPLLDRAVQGTDALGADLAVRSIRSVHGDYSDAMHDAVSGWANTLSGLKKKVALEIIASGEPEDVIDLITEYKEAKGIKNQPAGATQPAQQTSAATAGQAAAAGAKSNVTQLSDAAKKAATALGVVETKRSAATPGTVDPNDFDGAWEEATVAAAK